MTEVTSFNGNFLDRKGEEERGIQLQFTSLRNTEGGLFAVMRRELEWRENRNRVRKCSVLDMLRLNCL